MILVHLLTGALCATLLFLSIIYLKPVPGKVSITKWLIIVAEIMYLGFVVEMVAGFIDERALQAALVMGSIFGTIAIIGAVIIYRFIFLKSNSSCEHE